MSMNEMNQMHESLGIRREVGEFVAETKQMPKERFEFIDAVAEYNQMKVIKGMRDSRVSDTHSAAITGYGYNGLGRDTLEDVYISVFHGKSVLARPWLTSGTRAPHIALSDSLRLGDELLSSVGRSYDILEEVAGIKDSVRSPKEYEVPYRQVELPEGGSFSHEGIVAALNEKTKLVTIRHSKDYIARLTLSVKRTGRLISFIKNIKPDVTCVMDNCYGEFVETTGPTDVGTDMIVDSLIKNPDGELASIGGYIVNRKDRIEWASYRLNVPGLGKEVGASLGLNQ